MSIPLIGIIDRRLVRRFPVRPSYVTAAFLSIARHYFSRPEYMVTERFKARHNSGVEPSPQDYVVIQSPMAWPFEYADKRPAVFVRRLDWVVRRLGLGDGRWGGTEEVIKERLMSWYLRGFHAFHLVSREGGELELLTEEMINLLLRFTPLIRMIFPFQKFQLVSIGRPQAFISATDMFTSSLIVRYEWVETWQFTPDISELEESILETMLEYEEGAR